MLHNLIIYGGSFDPPHLGHLNTAVAVQNHMQFERFIFLPCKNPVLKMATTASCAQRVQMLKLALKPWPKFEIDLREIDRDTPSFMVDTLQSFRDELGKQVSITLLLGEDAFLQLPQWHRWQTLLQLCHLLVIKRPGVRHESMPEELKTRRVTDDIFNSPHGNIYHYNAGEYDISSSCLRQKMKDGEDVSPYLPEFVYQYINEYNIYAI